MTDGGAYAMFDGVESPLTQTFGLGMVEPVTDALLERIEAFFAGRGAPTFHEVSPLADPSALAALTGRGYAPFEFTSVLYQPLPGKVPPPSPGFQIRVVEASDGRTFVEIDDLRYGFPGRPADGLWGIRVPLDDAGRPAGPAARFNRPLRPSSAEALGFLFREAFLN